VRSGPPKASVLPVYSEIDSNKMIASPILKIEQETSLPSRLEQVKDVLHCLKRDIDPSEYQGLCDLIELLKDACVIIGQKENETNEAKLTISREAK
jgi:hypothetical protein